VFPLATHLGWRALAAIVVLPLAALVDVVAAARQAPARHRRRPGPAGVALGLAWQVTLFMGLNSFIYYVMIGWLPSVLASSGHSAAEAGSLHGVMQLPRPSPGCWWGPSSSA
jgi:CP family cyanate transporter-like MFS transporter